jgi:hypothetical protein
VWIWTPVVGLAALRKQTPLPPSSGLGRVISVAGSLEVLHVEEPALIAAVLRNVLNRGDDVVCISAGRIAATQLRDLADGISRKHGRLSALAPLRGVIEPAKAARTTMTLAIAGSSASMRRFGNRGAEGHVIEIRTDARIQKPAIQ